MTGDDLEAAWAAVHDATPAGWYVGRPSYHDERSESERGHGAEVSGPVRGRLGPLVAVSAQLDWRSLARPLSPETVAGPSPEQAGSGESDDVDVLELNLRLTSLSIDGRRVPVRDGAIYARRRLDADGLAKDVTDREHRNWSGWVSAFNMYTVAGRVAIVARSREGRRVSGPAWVTTTATPTGTYLELLAVEGHWIEGLGDGWDQQPTG